MTERNVQVLMKRHPAGMVTQGDFSIVEADLPKLQPGQA